MNTQLAAYESCNHQLTFAASLDDAATCARCGAIALIERREPGDGATRIRWIASDKSLHNDSNPTDAVVH
jgi:hypothetical protein